MSMSDIYCVTSRSLCGENFLKQIEMIASCHPAGIILREKDLPKEEYKILAEQVMLICRRYQVSCILHSFADIALELGAEAIHFPLSILRTMPSEIKEKFSIIGASCHSVEEAVEAQALGCSYITAGHVFNTACKEGVPGRGIAFLQEVSSAVQIPVYAIGGIHPANAAQVRQAGADGICLMSSLMLSENIPELFRQMEETL